MRSTDSRTRWGRAWRGGPFRGERYGTSLRWLEANGRECVRMIALVVRDSAWRTLAPDAGSVRLHAGPRGRWIVRARTRVGRGTLDWRIEIASRAQGIDVSATMTAERDIVTNRAGLVVLLPVATFAGARYFAQHTQGKATRGRLPEAIAPHQPLLDLAGARIAAPDGTTLSLVFGGEVFEMEDQRNWLDPTFKLYSRALARPFPYRLRDGTAVRQTVAIDLLNVAAPRKVAPARPRPGRLPLIGVATAPGRVPRDTRITSALREIEPRFLVHRTGVSARDVGAAHRLAASLGTTLRLECFGVSPALAEAVAQARPEGIAIYKTPPHEARALRRRAPDSARIGGTFSDFVLLNRNGLDRTAQRAVFALCPTVHARDDRSLVETLDALPRILAQAKRIAGDRPLDVGPCSLRRRLVPRTGQPADRPPTGDGKPYDVDPRQGEPIAAAWLVCVIALASVARVASVCTFEAAGARGIIDATQDDDREAGATRTPVHAALAALGRRLRAPLRLYRVNAAAGAAFALTFEREELWLVDLLGRARELPAPLGPASRIVGAQGGFRWSRPTGARLSAYGIARFAMPDRDEARVRRIAAAWCEGAAATSDARMPRTAA